MPKTPVGVCGRGLHDLDDPRIGAFKVYSSGHRQRYCLPCSVAIRRAKPLPELTRRPTPKQIDALQDIAYGLTPEEIAQRDGISAWTVRDRLYKGRRTLAVTPTTAAAVAVCLAYELIKPDESGPLPPKGLKTAPHALSVIALIQGRRKPLLPLYWQRGRLLDAAYAWSEPHAVSVLWAAGLIIPRDVSPLFAKEK